MRLISLFLTLLLGACGGLSEGDQVIVFEKGCDQCLGYIDGTIQGKDNETYVIRVSGTHNDNYLNVKQNELIRVPSTDVFPLEQGTKIAELRKKLYSEDLFSENSTKIKALGQEAKVASIDQLVQWIDSGKSLSGDLKKLASIPRKDACSAVDSIAHQIESDLAGFIKSGNQWATEVTKGSDSFPVKSSRAALPVPSRIIKKSTEGFEYVAFFSKACDSSSLTELPPKFDNFLSEMESTLASLGYLADIRRDLQHRYTSLVQSEVDGNLRNATTLIEARVADENWSIECNPEDELRKEAAKFGVSPSQLRLYSYQQYADSCNSAMKEKRAFIVGKVKDKIIKDGGEGLDDFVDALVAQYSVSQELAQYIRKNMKGWVANRKAEVQRKEKVAKYTKLLNSTRWVGSLSLSGLNLAYYDIDFKSGIAKIGTSNVQNNIQSKAISFKVTANGTVTVPEVRLSLKIGSNYLEDRYGFRLMTIEMGKKAVNGVKNITGSWIGFSSPGVTLSSKKIAEALVDVDVKASNGNYHYLAVPYWRKTDRRGRTFALISAGYPLAWNSKKNWLEDTIYNKPLYHR